MPPRGGLIPQPTAIDRVIAHFSPGRALERHKARCALALTGGYTGARSDRKATKNWRPVRGGANDVTIGDLPALRARSQDLIRNTPIAAGAFAGVLVDTVGTGLWPRPRLDLQYLGLTEEKGKEISRQMDRLWTFWAGTTACDVQGQFNFAQYQALTLACRFRDGDCLITRPLRTRKSDPFELRLQAIDAGRVRNPRGVMNSETLIDGVEVDSDGLPVRYHVSSQFEAALSQPLRAEVWSALPAFGSRTGLRQTLHPYEADRPGLTRGVPELAPVIEVVKQLSRYLDTEVDAAVANAFFAAFVITRAAEEGEEDLAPIAGVGPEDEERGEITLEGAQVIDLAPGEDIKVASPARPNPAFGPFMEACLRQIGMALGIPYEVLILHFTASYSAARASLLKAWKTVLRRRAFLVDQLCDPVREWFLWECVAKGWLNLPGFHTDPFLRRAWCECVWIGDPIGSIDPFKEVKAAELRMKNQITTLDEEVTAHSGGDYERNIQQGGRELRMRREAGLVPAEAASTPPDAAQAATEARWLNDE